MTHILQDILKLKDDQVEISPEAKQLLDDRLESHRRNPYEGSKWSEVKARIKEKL